MSEDASCRPCCKAREEESVGRRERSRTNESMRSPGSCDSRQTSQTDMRRLSHSLPPQLLRSVPAHLAMAGYGKHFRSSAGGSDDFSLSAPAATIDDFISHDWQTSGLDKTFSLCFLYNSKVALVGSTVVALAVWACSLVASMHVPYAAVSPGGTAGFFVIDNPCICVVPFVYFLLLFHWQRIRAASVPASSISILSRPPELFVDKLCIHQDNEQMKEQGILGLAAFLRMSTRMVLLWSPRYFTRLWCTYELATWFALGRQTSEIMLVPVMLGRFFVTTSAAAVVYGLAIRLAEYCLGSNIQRTLGIIFCSLLAFGFICANVLQGLQVQLKSLSKQLASFSIQDAECFCCVHAHKHPDTGDEIPCDRDLVYRTLKVWLNGVDETTSLEQLASSASDCSKFLLSFDEGVQTLLRDTVMSMVFADTVQLRYVELLHCSLPLLWLTFDNAVRRLKHGEAPGLVAAATWDGFSQTLLVAPCTVMLLFRIMANSSSCFGALENSRGRFFLSTLFWGPVAAVIAFLLWLPGVLFFWFGMYWGQVLWSLALVAILLRLRSPRRPRVEEGPGPSTKDGVPMGMTRSSSCSTLENMERASSSSRASSVSSDALNASVAYESEGSCVSL
eukprot:TRINITY_DN17509_c0_g1_i1.p1 TRINITY_DN17509_c0_g1~~TRINITY_DN17509_c0_g1_i1.p1  ORF type:complete len:619 (+),score=54.34 TRINITY_DN17509_c0_g1_i1:224-2080(+)